MSKIIKTTENKMLAQTSFARYNKNKISLYKKKA